MARFFIAGTNILGGTAIIRGRDAEHVHVLRMRPGEDMVICDGQGIVFRGCGCAGRLGKDLFFAFSGYYGYNEKRSLHHAEDGAAELKERRQCLRRGQS